MLTSNASEPVRTSAQSPDILPITGYSADQLADYIFRQLGSPVWNVELTKQQVLDCIQDAMALISIWRPQLRYYNLSLVKGIYAYLQGVYIGLGVAQIDFVEPNPVPTEIFYGNLINPAPLFRTGLDEYDTFLRWRKVWQRVTSIQPQWLYDDARKTLYIHNPIERYQAGLQLYWPITNANDMDAVSAQWVKEYALEHARYLYGEILAKYSGAVPAPAKDMTLDQQKRQNAQARMDKLRERLQGMQLIPPCMID
jgi:hypothetical protein